MAEWLEQASQQHEMYCHDLEVMRSNFGYVVLQSKVILQRKILSQVSKICSNIINTIII